MECGCVVVRFFYWHVAVKQEGMVHWELLMQGLALTVIDPGPWIASAHARCAGALWWYFGRSMPKSDEGTQVTHTNVGVRRTAWARTKDRTAANRMLGVRALGLGADIAPKRLLDDTKAHLKLEKPRPLSENEQG